MSAQTEKFRFQTADFWSHGKVLVMDLGFFLTKQAMRRQISAMPCELYLIRLIHTVAGDLSRRAALNAPQISHPRRPILAGIKPPHIRIDREVAHQLARLYRFRIIPAKPKIGSAWFYGQLGRQT
jgi:hypothetical protein